ncbi:flagellar basal body-associated FliL family protein [Salipiger marinus]|uniref:Flagellar protein FliL n=1 Tax=Salipiger marinus TaxID=555512 RepID=A0A1G8ULW5_9RHOB|nr:flagellar basal body-associated FliL family protein [Salipiger marinus]SDJ54802.1 hypothetical protein SAMN04487993_104418 [Salipiger marinus]
MKKLLPVLLALFGTGAGIGAGLMLAPAPPMEEATEVEPATGEEGHAEDSHAAPPAKEDAHAEDGHAAEGTTSEFVKLSNQFIIPVVGQQRVSALVVLTISIEATAGSTEVIYAQEPKLRDAFLRALFDHANIGGFDGNFTEAHRMDVLRRILFESARNALGPRVIDVLVTDIARQDS